MVSLVEHVEHVERWRMSTWGLVRRRSIIIVKSYPRIIDRRTVSRVVGGGAEDREVAGSAVGRDIGRFMGIGDG